MTLPFEKIPEIEKKLVNMMNEVIENQIRFEVAEEKYRQAMASTQLAIASMEKLKQQLIDINEGVKNGK